MKRPLTFSTCALFIALLQGCGLVADTDLVEWTEAQRKKTPPKIIPVDKPKPFFSVVYEQAGAIDPSSPRNLIAALYGTPLSPNGDKALLKPELERKREPLEAFPLDTLQMVGRLKKVGREVALIKVENLIHTVAVGGYLGQNYGKVTRITETTVSIREIVQDAGGEWVERASVMELQVGKTK